MPTFLECLENNLPMKNGAWKKKENQIIYFKWLEKKLKYNKPEDWYNISSSLISKNKGRGVLRWIGILQEFIIQLFPEANLVPWKFRKVPPNFWKNYENHVKFFNSLKPEYKTYEDFYKLTKKKIIDEGGGALLQKYYDNTPRKFIEKMIPNYEFLPWKFTRTTKNSWSNIKIMTLYISWLGKKLGYNKLEDWYKVSQKDFTSNYGSGMMYRYNHSPIQILKKVFPNYNWLEWKMNMVPPNFWKNRNNRIRYMNFLFKELGFTKMEDWYKVKSSDFKSSIIGEFNSSYQALIKDTYPDFSWDIDKFFRVPNNYWNDVNNHKLEVEKIKKKLVITNMEDWYNVDRNVFNTTMLKYYNNSHINFLCFVYPNYEWDFKKFKRWGYSLGQIEWLNYLLVETPDIRHILNHPDGEFKIPNTRYRADGYSEKEKTVFEFDGDAYHGNPNVFNSKNKSFFSNKTYGELYSNTIQRKKEIQQQGFKVVSVWESDWNNGINAIIKLQHIFKKKFIK